MQLCFLHDFKIANICCRGCDYKQEEKIMDENSSLIFDALMIKNGLNSNTFYSVQWIKMIKSIKFLNWWWIALCKNWISIINNRFSAWFQMEFEQNLSHNISSKSMHFKWNMNYCIFSVHLICISFSLYQFLECYYFSVVTWY